MTGMACMCWTPNRLDHRLTSTISDYREPRLKGKSFITERRCDADRGSNAREIEDGIVYGLREILIGNEELHERPPKCSNGKYLATVPNKMGTKAAENEARNSIPLTLIRTFPRSIVERPKTSTPLARRRQVKSKRWSLSIP